MNLVTERRGAPVTVTVNVQVAVWPLAAPVAAHTTVVFPTANDDPDTGVHVVWMGAVPPAVTGAGHDTVADWPWLATAVCAAGHAIDS